MNTRMVFAALTFAAVSSACGRCNKQVTDTTATNAATTTEAKDAGGVTAPYFPARSAPDDSNAPVSQVEPVLFSLRPGLNLCYRVASHSDPNINARAIFAVTIGGNGRVTNVNLASTETPLDPALGECVKRVLFQGEFAPPPDGGLATIAVPITFQPPRGGWKDAGGF